MHLLYFYHVYNHLTPQDDKIQNPDNMNTFKSYIITTQSTNFLA